MNRKSAAIGIGALMACCLLASCSTASPRPETTATAPPIPAGTVPIGRVTWTTAAMPAGMDPDAMIHDAAGSDRGFVLVGETGPGSHGLVVHSADGRTWMLVKDPDLADWVLTRVVATNSGYVAIGGHLTDDPADGSIGWIGGILTSADGRAWSIGASFIGDELTSIAARGETVVVVSDGPAVIRSEDGGASWDRTPAADVGMARGLPTAIAAMANGRWLALGTNEASAVAWHSDDGKSWSPMPIDAADPVPGVKAVEPYSIAAGSFGAVAAGNEVPERCEDGDDFCGRYGTGWSTSDGGSWMRLPRGTPLTEQWGVRIWPAGDAGVVANAPAFAQSATGWKWSTIPGDLKSPFIETLAIHGPTIVVAGLRMDDTAPNADTISVGSIDGP